MKGNTHLTNPLVEGLVWSGIKFTSRAIFQHHRLVRSLA